MKSESANRRSSARLNIRLPLIITSEDGSLNTVAETRNWSTRGFFCTMDEPLGIDQRIVGLLRLTEPEGCGPLSAAICIEMKAQVLRVACYAEQPWFGIACATLAFRIVPANAWPRWSRPLAPDRMR